MELPISPDKLLPLALHAVQHMPDLERRKTPTTVQRLEAYQKFGAAVWAAVTSLGQSHYLAPFATKPLVGIWWHTMMTRSLEGTTARTAELLGALEQLRLVAPTAVRAKAEQVTDCLGELSSAVSGPSADYEERQKRVGAAQLAFLAACRIDLGYDLDPSAPVLSPWNPATWYRYIRWRWSNRRR